MAVAFGNVYVELNDYLFVRRLLLMVLAKAAKVPTRQAHL